MSLRVSYISTFREFFADWLKNIYRVKYASRIQSIVEQSKEMQRRGEESPDFGRNYYFVAIKSLNNYACSTFVLRELFGLCTRDTSPFAITIVNLIWLLLQKEIAAGTIMQ
jgi:hypothetical protein